MKIRRATVLDVPVLIELNRDTQALHAAAVPEVFRAKPPDDVVAAAFTSSIQGTSTLWLLAEELRPCGYLSADFRELPETWCHVKHQICYISDLSVAPEFRRKGVARALISELKREAEVRGFRRIELSVWSFNTEAKRAFDSYGFRPLMERRVL